MIKKILIWTFAFLFTVAIAYFQRVTGPTYPLTGNVNYNQNEISYKFLRSENTGTDLQIQIDFPDTAINAEVIWKRYKSNDSWTREQMLRNKNGFNTALSSQPPAGKLEYYVEIRIDENVIRLPEKENVVARYKGKVPLTILILHVIAMFGAMLFSTRTGLEFFKKEPKLKKLTWITIGLLAVGGLILGPIVQKYAFDAYWTGWPFGHDLTDNKTAVALIGWIVALTMYKRSKYPKRWALAAAIILLAVYLIPHSVLGSEIDYTKQDNKKTISKEITKEQIPQKL
ncbi:MAG: hypothetical protein CVV23_16930 [Ignavibacteriae bacterium HGW-Ignavibacteriae-2]|jgi:hypothetical protein|nr:MAG: hypothetical protein CVV23_16930 [Ignavibacteriae bacterium HGW-Ignavibacteriae-2]